MEKYNSLHIVLDGLGYWEITDTNSGKCHCRFQKKDDAINVGKKVSNNLTINLFIHEDDIMVKEK